jgi:hypothetical protein
MQSRYECEFQVPPSHYFLLHIAEPIFVLKVNGKTIMKPDLEDSVLLLSGMEL